MTKRELEDIMRRAFPKRECAWCHIEKPLGDYRDRENRLLNVCKRCRESVTQAARSEPHGTRGE